MSRNFVFIVFFVLFVSAASFTGCKKSSSHDPSDAMEAARHALSRNALERCAVEEFARARELMNAAEQALQAGELKRAEELANQAKEQARHARSVAEANPDCQENQDANSGKDGKGRDDSRSQSGDYTFKTVYFEFDSFELSDETRRVLEQHAREMLNQSNLRLRLEGHCSEEGTVEYNLALGSKRAQAVRKFLMNYGVDGSRVDTISYGMERPVGRGSINRRVEFDLR